MAYSASKAALEAMSAIWAKELAGTGITVNVLVPGGPTDTPFIHDASGIARERMLKPEIMGAPVSWMLSDASNTVTGRRISALQWDPAMPPDDPAQTAIRDAGWPELTGDVYWPDP